MEAELTMGYLIIRIEPCENDTKKEALKEPVIETIVRRARLGDTDYGLVGELLAKRGYELGPIVGGTTSKYDWPLTAYVYTSQNRDGYGRAGSGLHRWPVRRIRP